MREEFERFMKSKRLWSKWVINLKEIGYDTPENHFESLWNSPESFIRSSFLWRDSKEGLDFWDSLDKQWKNHLQQLKSKGGKNA